MSSIVGLDGLYPTFKIIKYTKKLLLLTKKQLYVVGISSLKELKKIKLNLFQLIQSIFQFGML